jgi:Raf kinase inhibitor-like YbhB/YbcL family protein
VWRWGVIVVLLCAGVVSGCGGEQTSDSGEGDAPPATTASIRVTSTAFTDGARIPVGFTCDGDETSPPLAWSAPDADKPAAWAVVVDDPDAPGGTFVHWVVLDIPAGTRSLAAGEAPRGSTQVTNSAGSADYAGPCPPSGTHHYRFAVYALPSATGLTADAGLDDALAKVRSSATATGTLVGVYQRGS